MTRPDTFAAIAHTPALEAMRRSVSQALRPQTAAEVMSRRGLQAHYQPIVRLSDAKVIGHESLIRGPVDTPLRNPDALFAAASAEGILMQLEQRCVSVGLSGWSQGAQDRRLFVNLSASALMHHVNAQSLPGMLGELAQARVAPASLVIEITEHERVGNLVELVAVADELRAAGLRFALDDFGDGRSSLRLWAELRPEIVKIDKYFIHQLDRHAVKVQTIKGLARFAETFGTTLLAEGIETEAELRIVRDLGIEMGQGYFLGRPEAVAVTQVLPAAGAVLASSVIAVMPELTRAANANFSVGRLAVNTPPVTPQTTSDEVSRMFDKDPLLHALAVVEDGRPLGLVNRQTFVDRYAKPFFKELYGRKACLTFANSTPLILDQHTGIDGLTAVLTSTDQRYLNEGFIVTAAGRYLGLGTGQQLVRVVTEVRIEAARHANPLTFLPGNIPITEHIDRLLNGGAEFVACYCDLNDFKPYNDQYGYWRGDEMIRLVARTLAAHCDPRRDFIGHVGGDDFVVLFQSNDWQSRCEAVIKNFNDQAVSLFDEEARQRGGIEAEDRHGVKRFFHFTTLSIGAVPVRPGSFTRPEGVASAAAAAKHKAKASSLGLAIESA
jgi:diguanylate cyclase (GGDEF)-like protein